MPHNLRQSCSRRSRSSWSWSWRKPEAGLAWLGPVWVSLAASFGCLFAVSSLIKARNWQLPKGVHLAAAADRSYTTAKQPMTTMRGWDDELGLWLAMVSDRGRGSSGGYGYELADDVVVNLELSCRTDAAQCPASCSTALAWCLVRADSLLGSSITRPQCQRLSLSPSMGLSLLSSSVFSLRSHKNCRREIYFLFLLSIFFLAAFFLAFFFLAFFQVLPQTQFKTRLERWPALSFVLPTAPAALSALPLARPLRPGCHIRPVGNL